MKKGLLSLSYLTLSNNRPPFYKILIGSFSSVKMVIGSDP